MNTGKNNKSVKIAVILLLVAVLAVLGIIFLGGMKNTNAGPVQKSVQVSNDSLAPAKKPSSDVSGNVDDETAGKTEATSAGLGKTSSTVNSPGRSKTPATQSGKKTEQKTSAGTAPNTEKPLEGLIIGIDPGHQSKGNNSLEKVAPGSDGKKPKVTSGTQGRFTGVPEYKLNLEVGLLLKKELSNSGAKIVMTRETNNVDISNIQRAQLTNKSKCDMVIRLHANGAESAKSNGYSILIPGEKYSTKDIVRKSRSFAEVLNKTLKDNIDIRPEGIITRNDLTGFNWSETPVVLLEMGYMTNKHDDETMQTGEFKNGTVKSIARALEIYFKGKK